VAKTAKVVRFHKAGGPEVLQVEELPIPEPADRKDRRQGVSRTDSDWYRLACLLYQGWTYEKRQTRKSRTHMGTRWALVSVRSSFGR